MKNLFCKINQKEHGAEYVAKVILMGLLITLFVTILNFICASCSMSVDNQDFHFESKVEYPELIENTK